MPRDRGGIGRERGAGSNLGEAEVEDLRVPASREEQVCRFDVAMDDALRVRSIEGICDLLPEIEDRRLGHRAGAEHDLERIPLEEFHDEKAPRLVPAEVVDRADVGVIERRGRSGFALEALDCRDIVRQFRGQELERDLPAQAQILGTVDNAHAAATEFFDDAVVGDGLAGGRHPRHEGRVYRTGRRSDQTSVLREPGEPTFCSPTAAL